MASSRRQEFSAKFSPQCFAEVTQELRVSVRYYTSREPMQSNNFLEEESCNITSIIYFVAWNKMNHFGKAIHHHKD